MPQVVLGTVGRGRGVPEAAGLDPDACLSRSCSLQEDAKAKEEDGVPDDEGWVKVTRRGRRPVLPRTEAASLRVLEREKRKRARKELLNFYAWQHRETKMERKGAPPAPPQPCGQSTESPRTGSGPGIWAAVS